MSADGNVEQQKFVLKRTKLLQRDDLKQTDRSERARQARESKIGQTETDSVTFPCCILCTVSSGDQSLT